MGQLNQLTQEYKEWLNKLIFIQDEFRYFNNKINYLMTTSFKMPIHKQASSFRADIEANICRLQEMQQLIENHIDVVNTISSNEPLFLEGHETKRKAVSSFIEGYKSTKNNFNNMVLSINQINNNYLA